MEDDVRIRDRARYRFHADRLPVSKQPVVALEEVPDDRGLETLGEDRDLFLTLDRDAPLEHARELAEMLNRRVRRVSLAVRE